MTKAKVRIETARLASEQIDFLQTKMSNLARRNPSWGIAPENYKDLFPYLAVQKTTYLYDDELFEGLRFVDHKKTGKSEELLDAYLILDQGDELHLKLFQFKFKNDYSGGISTKELYAFVDRMNRVFLRSDLLDETALEGFAEVRSALDEARRANKRARTRIQCYYIVNGQNVSHTDETKIQEIRDTFAYDRQTSGFTFETYGGTDIHSLCAHGRIPIQDESIELIYDFQERSILHHNIGANPSGMPIQVLVGFVNVNQLIRLVDRYSNNELFEKNVRLFLGTGKEVNRRIIETITGNQSAWFGFMNNGVSITADSVDVDLPPSKKVVKVRLGGMQIINGCQTVNALYHAKYALELKDRFQGNSHVLVRIYQIPTENRDFLDALIIATNSQNAIRPEDLLANDGIQKTLQAIYREYRIGYERKEGEILPEHVYTVTFSKEQAGMSYLAVFMGHCSRLRNSLSRREFFRQGDDYYRAFDLRGAEGEEEVGALPDDFEPGEPANRRALQILAAFYLVEGCRTSIKAIKDKQQRGSLRKGGFYLARISYLQRKDHIDNMIVQWSTSERKPEIAEKLQQAMSSVVKDAFNGSRTIFLRTLEAYLKQEGTNEDAALKNRKFAHQVDENAKSVKA